MLRLLFTYACPVSSFSCPRPHSVPHSFPTRRSSDLLFAGRTACGIRQPGQNGPAVATAQINSCFVSFERNCQHRSEEHTSELQSRGHLVCRLLLEKKKTRPVRTSESSRCSTSTPATP